MSRRTKIETIWKWKHELTDCYWLLTQQSIKFILKSCENLNYHETNLFFTKRLLQSFCVFGSQKLMGVYPFRLFFKLILWTVLTCEQISINKEKTLVIHFFRGICLSYDYVFNSTICMRSYSITQLIINEHNTCLAKTIENLHGETKVLKHDV